jgi:hypothetical protein
MNLYGCLILFDAYLCVFVICATHCKMEHPAEVHFYRASVRCKMELSVGQIPVQRTPSVYSAAEPRFSAPIFSAPVGDALTNSLLSLLDGNTPCPEIFHNPFYRSNGFHPLTVRLTVYLNLKVASSSRSSVAPLEQPARCVRCIGLLVFLDETTLDHPHPYNSNMSSSHLY